MTQPATGPVATEISDRLTRAFAPSHLHLDNRSRHHAGHMGDDGTGESHFHLVIESPAFAGTARLERQRMVHQVLGPDLLSRVHALSMKIYAQGERE